MLDLTYEILKSVYLNNGTKDLDKLISELTVNLTDDERFNLQRRIIGKVTLFQSYEYDFISKLPLSSGSIISSKYSNFGWARQLDEDETTEIEITEKGIKEYFSLNARYNPPISEPVVTHIYHAPVFGDVKDSNIITGNDVTAMQEINKNKESELEKKALIVHKHTRAWTVVLVALAVITIIITLWFALRGG